MNRFYYGRAFKFFIIHKTELSQAVLHIVIYSVVLG